MTFKVILAILTYNCRKFGLITCNGFVLESPNLYQICILGFSQLVLKMGVIGLDLQAHLAIISTQEKAFNIALLY